MSAEYAVMRVRREVYEELKKLKKYPTLTFSQVVERLLDSYNRQKGIVPALKEIKEILKE